MVKFRMFILISTSPLEFVNGELEDVPLLDVAVKRCDSMLLISLCIVNVVVGVDKLLVNRFIRFDSIDLILYLGIIPKSKRRCSEMDYSSI